MLAAKISAEQSREAKTMAAFTATCYQTVHEGARQSALVAEAQSGSSAQMRKCPKAPLDSLTGVMNRDILTMV